MLAIATLHAAIALCRIAASTTRVQHVYSDLGRSQDIDFIFCRRCFEDPELSVQVPVMVRVEVEKLQRLQFQVTVASTDGNTTSSIKDIICQLLAKL